MALTEPQIQRYSRQILLRGVGGIGQQRLLAARVALLGEGQALATAAAYLAGGGCQLVRDGGGPLGGFLAGGDPAELNPDAVATPGAASVAIGQGDFAYAGPEVATVHLSQHRGRGRVLFRGPGACFDCMAEYARAAGPAEPLAGALAVAAGTLGALCAQRLVLGLGPPLGGVWLEEDGTVVPLDHEKCGKCGA